MTVSPGPKSLIKLVKSDNRNDYHRGGIVARGDNSLYQRLYVISCRTPKNIVEHYFPQLECLVVSL